MVINDGAFIIDPAGNPIFADDRSFAESQHYPTEYVVGKRWTTRYKVRTRAGTEMNTISFVIKARERVTVPAGTFKAFRAEGSGFGERGGRREFTWWAAPDKVRARLKSLQQIWDERNVPVRMELNELVAFRETR